MSNLELPNDIVRMVVGANADGVGFFLTCRQQRQQAHQTYCCGLGPAAHATLFDSGGKHFHDGEVRAAADSSASSLHSGTPVDQISSGKFIAQSVKDSGHAFAGRASRLIVVG